MMPVIRISEATYAHLQKHAKPFEDSPESIIQKALAALDLMNGEPPPPPRPPEVSKGTSPKLPQKEFRYPLLLTLLALGGSAPAKTVREKMEARMKPKLLAGDYEPVSTGDPRWWNAVCWERANLVSAGLMQKDTERGIWEISEAGRNLETSVHVKQKGTDKVVDNGTLEAMAEKYRNSLIRKLYFFMVGDERFEIAMPTAHTLTIKRRV